MNYQKILVTDKAGFIGRSLVSKLLKTGSKVRTGDIHHNFADITRLKTHLNFKPKMSLIDGPNQFSDLIQAQPILSDKGEKQITNYVNSNS